MMRQGCKKLIGFAETQTNQIKSHIHGAVATRGYHERNVGSFDVGTGLVGAPACGDVMIKVDEETFGCGSAIASSSSVAAEWVKGRQMEEVMTIKNSCVLQENEFHKLAESTIHHLLEKLEEYGDNIDVDEFDIDYGNEVLTLKLGNLGTYVLNKQTPNRQIWLSSPVSGPARFDWDSSSQAWVYRRNNANLFRLLESELKELCGEPVNLS